MRNLSQLTSWIASAAVAVMLWAVAPTALRAQPSGALEAFYRGEEARRSFHDGFAFTSDLSLHQGGGNSGTQPWLGLGLRGDLKISDTFDLIGVVQATGAQDAGDVGLAWLGLKYYRHVPELRSDYALRLAVDPASNGRAGFPRVDAAFIYTTMLSPWMMSDFAVGVRRVNIAYQQINAFQSYDAFQRGHVRADGWELHAMMSYRLLVDMAGSHVVVGLSGDFGRYGLHALETPQAELPGEYEDVEWMETWVARNSPLRMGVVWFRSGLTWERPAYRVAPYVAVPVHQWDTSGGSQRNLQAGVELQLR